MMPLNIKVFVKKAEGVSEITSRKRFFKMVNLALLFATALFLALFLLHDDFDISSSNAVLYFIKGGNGFLTVTRDLSIEDADKLLFMLDFSFVYTWLFHSEAIATKKTVFDVTWDDDSGKGEIKQFRPDGTIFAVTFSRFIEDDGSKAKGLFIGGDFSYGDYNRSADKSTSGMSYYDGKRWNHIWCAANEGFAFRFGRHKVYSGYDWRYLSGRVLKKNKDEVMLESLHSLEADGMSVLMKRWVSMRAGEDYLTLDVEFINNGKPPIEYAYEYGDEPWVGKYSDSLGDVGWSEKGLVRYESFISPIENRYAGYWDYGNDAAGEGHNFTGYANFIEWVTPAPSLVSFSNDFTYCCYDEKPLESHKNRVINLVWSNQVLSPGEGRRYRLIIGKANINPKTGFPEAPVVMN